MSAYVVVNGLGHAYTLRLDDWEGSERTATKLVVHLSRTLEETRVEVEDIALGNISEGDFHGHLQESLRDKLHAPGVMLAIC